MKRSFLTDQGIWYLDVFAESILEKGKVRLRPLEGQAADTSLRIECSRQIRTQFGVGTVFKLDVRLVTPYNKRPYLISRNRKKLVRALEYFDRNRKIQKEHVQSVQLSLF